MFILDRSPKNNNEFIRLVHFLKEILVVCKSLDIEPVLSGSLAVFAYTKNQTLRVNDIDLACSEHDFPRIIKMLDNEHIEFRLKDWHVLQVWQDDLKVEFDSMEHWMQNLSTDYEILQLDTLSLKMVSLADLQALYARGLAATANQSDANAAAKQQALQSKVDLLREALDR